jgi:hypothetical protein
MLPSYLPQGPSNGHSHRGFQIKISHFSHPPCVLRIRPPHPVSFIFLHKLPRAILLGSCSSEITPGVCRHSVELFEHGMGQRQQSVRVITLPCLLQPVTNGARLGSEKTREWKENFELQASFYVTQIVPRLENSPYHDSLYGTTAPKRVAVGIFVCHKRCITERI